MNQENNMVQGFLQPRDAWDRLSMREKAEMMKVAVDNGIYNLKEIRQKYNEFAKGGDTKEEEYLTTMERVAENNYRNWGFSNPDEALVHALNDNTYNYRGYYDAYPQSTADASIHWSDEFKTVYHPTFSDESIYSGQRSQYNPLGLTGGYWVGDTFIPRAWQMLDSNKHSIGGPLVEVAMNEYKNGGGIHIKPSHRGRLTELKKRTGKTEAELYRTGSPATRKMITFARNARKWKHGLGGNLVGGEEEGSQQMNIAVPDATYVASMPLFYPISRKEYDWEDAALHRTNQVYSNYDEAKDEPLSLGNTLFRNGLRWIKDNIYEDFPSGVSNCTLSATQWVDPQTPVKGAKSIYMNPERFNYTAIDSAEVVPGNLIISKVPDKDNYHTMMVTGFADQDSTVNFRGKNYSVKKGEPLMTYSRGGHDASFIQRNIPLSVYTANSDGHTQNLFYRYNYPREVFLPEIIITPNKKKK